MEEEKEKTLLRWGYQGGKWEDNNYTKNGPLLKTNPYF